jgi:hypothetical protein
MKQLSILLVHSISILLLFSGCKSSWRNNSPDATGKKTNRPPKSLAGTWKAQDNPWKIVLSPNGTISSIVIPLAEVEIRPNRITKMEMKDGSISTFKGGSCVAEYTPQTRELFVSIEIKKIHIKFFDIVIDGNSIDRLVGPVSEDGKVWTADWITTFDYGPHLPQDINDIYAEQLIFEKIKD